MSLLNTRRFLPLFLTQFLGAFNDNLLKNALVMLVTYRLAVQAHGNAQVLVTLAAGLFILPFFLFSATAGQLADKVDRARLTRIIKVAEIVIMLFATTGFILHSAGFLLFVLFCMGVHSTFFGPIKYALLPQHLRDGELLSGNAYIEAGTFLAILIGTILGGVLILQPGGVAFVSAALVGVAVLGYLASRSIPAAPPPEPSIRIGFNIWRETWRIVGFARANRRVFLSILGASWFWLAGATYLAQFPTYVKDVLHADAAVVTLFLTVFSVGIGVGSFLCNKLLRGEIHSAYVPAAALGMAVFGIDLYFASHVFIPSPTGGGLGWGHNLASVPNCAPLPASPLRGEGLCLMSLGQFLGTFSGWRIVIDLFLIAVAAGLYIVPLYAIMQHESAPGHRARIIAANNVMNALFMVASAIFTLAMLAASFTIPQVFLAVAAANIIAAWMIRRLRGRNG